MDMKQAGEDNVMKTTITDYLNELKSVIGDFPLTELSQLAKLLLEKREKSTLFIAGNGGSASTASHMATDLGVGSLSRRNPVRAISITENNSVISAVSNDLSYDQIFATQIRLLAAPGDILICFSASGNSPNIIEAINVAKNLGIYTVAITGFNGGLARKQADLSIHIETREGSYGVVEDVHLTISHILTEIIRSSDG
jgi:D-sedoheptulose 7-phosphate isomerase